MKLFIIVGALMTNFILLNLEMLNYLILGMKPLEVTGVLELKKLFFIFFFFNYKYFSF